MRLQLTDEQKAAAATRCARAYIESAPGSGKTTVAAERYGVARFNRADGRGVVALSFARSACGELERRVRSRWGADAIRWPHKVWTLDSLHCALVQHLLRCGIVHWPAGHTEIMVIDSWRGNRGSRPIAPGGFGRVVTLQGSAVTSVRRRKQVAGYGFDNKAAYEALLASGLSTHDEIRQVLDAVIARADLAPPVRDFFLGTTKALIVDEIFDGNIVDLNIVRLAAEAGVPTTIIGDPWQALYAFRGAEPALVPRLISELAFDTFPLSTSFMTGACAAAGRVRGG